MARTVLLALALALGGGAPYLGGLVDLLDTIWTAGQVDAGGHFDPDGSTTDVGGLLDPNGSMTDAGGHADPNGSGAENDAGSHYDPNG